MALITVDARSNVMVGGTGVTKAHTCAVGATLLLVSAVFGQSATETNFAGTYAGVALQEAYHSGGGYWDTYIYFVSLPASGANNVELSWTTSSRCSVHIISLKGTKLANPIRAADGGEFLSGDPQTKTLAASPTDYIFSACAGQGGSYNDSSAPLTDFADQNDTYVFGTGADGPAAGATVDVTWHNPSSNRFGFGAVTIFAGDQPAGIAFTPYMMF